MLFNRKCFCGKSNKNFTVDIGPNYQGECCEEAGYDHFGTPPAPKVEKVKKEGPTRRYTPSGKYSKKTKSIAEVAEGISEVLKGPSNDDE